MKQLLYKLVSKFWESLGRAYLGVAYINEMGILPVETGFFLEGVYPDQEEARYMAGLTRLRGNDHFILMHKKEKSC